MNNMERWAKEGDSPVSENNLKLAEYLSRAGHVKPGLNLGRPLSKAKYRLMTDSVIVPRGKGEKNPC